LRLWRIKLGQVAHEEFDTVAVGDQQARLRQAADVFLALQGQLGCRGW
jgi:hypothetical protein